MSRFRKFIERLIPEPRDPKWSYRVVPMNQRFRFRRLCPYCHDTLIYSITGWEFDEITGLWLATDYDCDCASAPEFDTEEWDEWARTHTVLPYVYQLPVDVYALNWINNHYRFYHS